MKLFLAINFSIFAGLLLLPAGVTRASDDGLNLNFGQQTFNVSQTIVNSWRGEQTLPPDQLVLGPEPGVQTSLLAAVGQNAPEAPRTQIYTYRLGLIYQYLKTLSPKIAQPAEEPILKIAAGRATQFSAPQTGQTLDLARSALQTLMALNNNQSSATLDIVEQPPQTALSQTNNLGINQLIGEGVSTFGGSPNNRRHNIAAGITKFQGVLLAPGLTFSFDDDLGPVTADAGFLPELVIDNGTTLPELGGGLCQVSTTAFRAAMSAGLPITDRRNHAYAVSYYSPQGTDATIYPGSADLKFINDTPGYILIWPYERDRNTLVFDFYGTGDGRKVTLDKPVVYDRQADGAMKATWTRIVTAADGQSRTDVFKSNYQSPALFHETETYVSATGTQISGLKIPVPKTQ